MNKRELHEEINDTWAILGQTYRLIKRLWNKELEEKCNISTEKSLNLLLIKCLGDDATPYRISRFQVQEHNTVSDILNRMEDQGLVTKVRESRGKSRVKLKLTEMGEQAYSRSIQRLALINILSVLSPDELRQLRSYLEKLRDEVLKIFEQEEEWPEIHIPPSQWANHLREKQAKDNPDTGSKAKASKPKSSGKRGRPRKTERP